MKPTLLAVLCLAMFARLASAQTHQEAGIFVEGGGFVTYEARSHADTNLSAVIGIVDPTTDNNTTVPGGTVGVGVFLRPFLSVRADALFEGESETSLYPTYLADLLAGDVPSSTLLASQDARTRTISVQALLAYHLASARRMRLAVLGGVSFDRHRTHLSSDVFLPAIPTLPGVGRTIPAQRFDYSVVAYNRELVVGVDGELAMGEHLALVPQFRVIGGNGSIRLQPGVNLRWRP